ncbi:MAG: KpsF/GutQ family sugar-phosphate isomerase [Gammaproteobacteria bacterium]|nr:KpsF/GutQ family sugar-phosphate isomerase [Gammaproteobacteria bacterium]
MGKAVIRTEADAVSGLLSRIDENFAAACQYMLRCQGRIVVLGMGKSGHIGGKIAATLASTGTPAFFVHPGEASHGDLGMITKQDVVLAISNSGETEELLTILPIIKRESVPFISLTGNPKSTLAIKADVHIDVSVAKEACPLGLAPTASTTATLAMGDALAVAMLEARGFTEEDFARSHPGGTLGRRLLLHIEDIMRSGDQVPMVQEDANLHEALVEISRKVMGFTAVVNKQNKLLGIFTDGDLRRLLDKGQFDPKIPIKSLMITKLTTIKPKALAVEALQLMEQHKINSFPVVDDHGVMIGALNIHDLLRAGVA